MIKHPRQIHFIWWQGVLPDDKKANVERWRTLNPGWEVKVWDREMIDDFIRAEYKHLYSSYKRIPKTKRRDKFREIRKVDCARLLILHRCGGAYFDCDLVPQRPLEAFLLDKVMYLRHFTRFELDQPILLQEIMQQPERICPGGSDYIAFRDVRNMDVIGTAVINGAFLSVAHPPNRSSWMLEFVQDRLSWLHRRQPVLQAFGSHALAYFLRERKKQRDTRDPDPLLLIPGHYVVWDRKMFGDKQWFVLAEHDGSTGGQSWGDDSKLEPWRDTK